MKAVDFIVDWQGELRFIEFKDPQHPGARSGQVDEFIQNFQSENLDADLVRKFRDSFVYEWASMARGMAPPTIHYFVLIALDTLRRSDLFRRTEALKNKIPACNRSPKIWNRCIMEGCGVFNIQAWNHTFPEFPVSRVSKP